MLQKVKTFLRILWIRLRIGLGRFWRRLRRVKFRQVMGVIVIIKTFNPLLFLLALVLFAFLTVKDIQAQLQPSLDIISANFTLLNQDFAGLQSALNSLRGAMQALGTILSVVKSIVNGIISFVNTIIDAIAWFFGMSSINLRIGDIIPDFSFVFKPFNDLALHFKGLFDGFMGLFSALQTIVINLWERFKVFFFLAVGWVLLSIFATAYAEVNRGLDLIRGPRWGSDDGDSIQTPLMRRMDTPPVVIVSQSLVTTPVLLGGPEGAASMQRTFVYQERHLLSALGVWPGRHAPLLYHQLVDQVNPGVWSVFWEGLIDLGYDLTVVEVVVSADTSALAPSVQRYLPKAHVAESIETHILGELPDEGPA